MSALVCKPECAAFFETLHELRLAATQLRRLCLRAKRRGLSAKHVHYFLGPGGKGRGTIPYY